MIIGGIAAIAYGDKTPATVQFKLAQKSATAGSKVKGTITITFPEGKHAYQNPPSKDYMIPLTVASASKEYKLGPVKYPKGVGRQTVGETEDVMVYEGTVEVPVVIELSGKPGPIVVKLTVGYQQCTEHDCNAPEEIVVTAKITVKPAKSK